jgi:hypothetical protein
VAFESPGLDARQLERLMKLALVECVCATPRLTALGRQRFEAPPKAPLLSKRRVPVGLVIEATLGKFATIAPDAVPEEPGEPALAPEPAPIFFDLHDLFDWHEWRRRSEQRLILVRKSLFESRRL